MGSSEARRGTKTVLRKTEAMFRNFSRINWPEGELLNNSLNGLYECNHRTKTNKEKGRHLCAILRHQRLSIVKKKTFTQVCQTLSHLCYLFWNNIVCVFGAELTIKPPFLTKNVVFHPRTRIPLVLARNARSNPQWSKVSRQNGLNKPQWFGHRFPFCDKRKADENIFGFTQRKQSIIRWFSLFVLLPLSLIKSIFTESWKAFKWS